MNNDPMIRDLPSPNFGERRGGDLPDMIVIHYTAMESAEAAIERLCDPQFEVSAHYVISERGEVTRLVAEEMRAWHAGEGSWQGVADVNSRSVGIELANAGDHPFSEPQMQALEALIRGIMARWDIVPERVIGHSDMAPGRKCDPGPRFDWQRLERQGLAGTRGCDAGPDAAHMAAFCAAARDAGFTAQVEPEVLLSAVRLRYRPWAEGPLTPEDFAPLS